MSTRPCRTAHWCAGCRERVGRRAEDVLLFFRDDSSGYRFPHVVQLYEEEKQRAVAKGLAVPPDGLPDPSNVDGDLNYHLEPYP